jgi:hypothetical protein
MAEFCKQCAKELDFPTDFDNMFQDRDMAPDGQIGFQVLCEGCGPAFIVDNEGTCAAKYCDCHHGEASVTR